MNHLLCVSGRLACGLLLLVALGNVAAGAEDDRGITVSGKGVVEAMPDVVELSATVAGNAELAGDAVEKYRGSKRLVSEALGKLNLKGVKIATSGLSVNSGSTPNMMAVMQGQGDQQKVAEKVAVQEQLTITLSGIDAMKPDELLETLTRIVDTAKDAGVTLGSGPKSVMEIQLSGGKPVTLATFKLSKADALRDQAYEAALKKARAKAERLAGLAGVELGEIVSIHESAGAGKSDSGDGGMATYFALLGAQASGQSADSATEFKAIPVTVNLTVQFAIKK